MMLCMYVDVWIGLIKIIMIIRYYLFYELAQGLGGVLAAQLDTRY